MTGQKSAGLSSDVTLKACDYVLFIDQVLILRVYRRDKGQQKDEIIVCHILKTRFHNKLTDEGF